MRMIHPLRATLLVISLLGAGLTIVWARPPRSEPTLGPVPNPPGLYSAASVETTWFGGTRWDAVDMRWEAIEDSIWTFESGVASAINQDPQLKEVGLHSLMEGWVGVDRRRETYTDPSAFRRMGESGFTGSSVCVGNATGRLVKVVHDGVGRAETSLSGTDTPRRVTKLLAGSTSTGSRPKRRSSRNACCF